MTTKPYSIWFQDSELMLIEASSAKEARAIFNKNMKVKLYVKQ